MHSRLQYFGVEADMWSLGCVLYLMLSGQPAFPESNFIKLCEMINKADYDITTAPWHLISNQAKDLIKNLLNVDYRSRWTADQVLQHDWLQVEETTWIIDEKLNSKASLIEVVEYMKRIKAFGLLQELTEDILVTEPEDVANHAILFLKQKKGRMTL
jgi:serine/threonine protein kinase